MQSKLLRQSRTHSRQNRASRKAVSRRKPSRRQHRQGSPDKQSVLSRPHRKLLAAVLDALLWLMGAVLVRLVVNGIMAMSSQFWLLGVMVACLPALTAIWMTHLSPRQGFVLGYRCLIVMTGLLLGGKIGGFS